MGTFLAGVMSHKGAFNPRTQCCVCWGSSQPHQTPLMQLACGHLLCLECMDNYKENHCPFNCYNGAFDRVKTLQSHGRVAQKAEALLPQEVILKKKRFGPVAHPGFCVSPLRQLPEFAIEEVCPEVSCSEFNKPVCNTTYGESLTGDAEFEWDLCKSTRSFCQCGAPRHVQQLLFTNCFANVEFCEKFQNGKNNYTHCKQNSSCKTTTLDMPGHYTVINVSTKDRPFFSTPEDSRSECNKPACNTAFGEALTGDADARHSCYVRNGLQMLSSAGRNLQRPQAHSS